MEEIQKQYYSIGEVSKLIGVQPSVIRFWETEFKQVQPRKNKKGNRVYTLKDIELLTYIRMLLRDKGYTIKGAQQILEEGNSLSNLEKSVDSIEIIPFLKIENQIDKKNIKELLIKLKDFLVELKNNL